MKFCVILVKTNTLQDTWEFVRLEPTRITEWFRLEENSAGHCLKPLQLYQVSQGNYRIILSMSRYGDLQLLWATCSDVWSPSLLEKFSLIYSQNNPYCNSCQCHLVPLTGTFGKGLPLSSLSYDVVVHSPSVSSSSPSLEGKKKIRTQKYLEDSANPFSPFLSEGTDLYPHWRCSLNHSKSRH